MEKGENQNSTLKENKSALKDILLGKGFISRLSRWIFNFWKLVFIAAKKFYHDHCFGDASSLAYVTILSVFPVIILLFAIFSSLESTKEIFKSTVETQIIPFFFSGKEVGKTLSTFLRDFSVNITTVTILGVGFLLLAAVDVVILLEKAINSIWNIKKGRSFLQNFLIYWAMLTLGPIFLVLSFYVTSKFFAGHHLIQKSAKIFFPFFITWIGFFLAYWLVPRTKVMAKSAAIGALVSGVLWEVGKFGFTIYVSQIGSETLGRIYGSLYVIPISIAWIYFSYALLLFGAQVSFLSQYPEIYKLKQYKKVEQNNFQLFYILNTLYLMYEKYQRGQGATSLSYLAEHNKLSKLQMDYIINPLIDAKLIKEFQKNSVFEYLPDKPMDQVSVLEIISLLESRTQLLLSNVHHKVNKMFNVVLEKMAEGEEKNFSNMTYKDLLSESSDQKNKLLIKASS